MNLAYYSDSFVGFLDRGPDSILGELVSIAVLTVRRSRRHRLMRGANKSASLSECSGDIAIAALSTSSTRSHA